MNFDIRTEQLSDHVYVISLAGEVDLYTAPEFKQQLLEVIGQDATHVIVDFSDTTFIDSTTLGVLVGGVKRLRTNDGQLSSSAATATSPRSSRSPASTACSRSTPPATKRSRRSQGLQTSASAPMRIGSPSPSSLPITIFGAGCRGDHRHRRRVPPGQGPVQERVQGCMSHTLAARDPHRHDQAGTSTTRSPAARSRTSRETQRAVFRDLVRRQIAYAEEVARRRARQPLPNPECRRISSPGGMPMTSPSTSPSAAAVGLRRHRASEQLTDLRPWRALRPVSGSSRSPARRGRGRRRRVSPAAQTAREQRLTTPRSSQFERPSGGWVENRGSSPREGRRTILDRLQWIAVADLAACPDARGTHGGEQGLESLTGRPPAPRPHPSLQCSAERRVQGARQGDGRAPSSSGTSGATPRRSYREAADRLVCDTARRRRSRPAGCCRRLQRGQLSHAYHGHDQPRRAPSTRRRGRRCTEPGVETQAARTSTTNRQSSSQTKRKRLGFGLDRAPQSSPRKRMLYVVTYTTIHVASTKCHQCHQPRPVMMLSGLKKSPTGAPRSSSQADHRDRRRMEPVEASGTKEEENVAANAVFGGV